MYNIYLIINNFIILNINVKFQMLPQCSTTNEDEVIRRNLIDHFVLQQWDDRY